MYDKSMEGKEEKKNDITDLEYQMNREKRDNMCSTHPKEILRGFCKNDFSAICFRCYLEQHKTHEEYYYNTKVSL